jgi:hypothetical protein
MLFSRKLTLGIRTKWCTDVDNASDAEYNYSFIKHEKVI